MMTSVERASDKAEHDVGRNRPRLRRVIVHGADLFGSGFAGLLGLRREAG
jgi:hypothetical protein